MKIKSMLVGALAAGVLAHAGPLSARTLSDIQATQSVNVVTTASSPPHGFKNPASNRLEGIMVDVAGEIASRLKASVRLTDVPFSGLIPTLTSGRADIMSAPLFVTEERAKVIDFSVPVYEWGEGVVVSSKSDKAYPDFESLRGARVGVLVDSVQFRMIKDMPDTRVSTYQDYATLLADVRAGRIDLGIVDPPSIIYQIQSRNIPGVRLDTGYRPQQVWQVGMAVEKGNAELLEAVNEALAGMKADGTLAAIGQKWGVSHLISK